MDLRVIGVAILGLALGFGVGYSGGPTEAGSAPAVALDEAAMERELAAALDLANTLERTRAVNKLIARLGPDNIVGARRTVNAKIITIRDCDMRSFVSAWAAFDPESAFENSLSWTATFKRGLGLREAAQRWALEGGALEARAYAASAPGREPQDAALTGLLQGWAESGDIAGVTEHLTSQSPGVGRAKFIGIVVSTLARSDGVAAVLDWFDAIPPDAGEAFMKEAFRGTLAVATQRGPNLAVPWWEKRQHEPYAVESVWVIPSLWIPQAPDAAIEWAMNLPSSPENNTALQTGIRRWYELDKGAAARWLASHPIPERFLAKLPKPVKKTIRQLRRAR